jgi:hypothetical protein
LHGAIRGGLAGSNLEWEKPAALIPKGDYRNMFAKKEIRSEEQLMQDMTDEQLDQVTGGSLAFAGLNALNTATSLVSGVVSSVSVSGVQINAAGVSISTPTLSTSGLISGLL